jgi:hypothetical protein
MEQAPKVKRSPRKKQDSSAVPVTKQKKEKKPVTVVAVVTPNGIEGSFSEPRKPLIVHLPFNSSDINFTDSSTLRYDPQPPQQPVPYEDESSNVYFQVETNTDAELSITNASLPSAPGGSPVTNSTPLTPPAGETYVKKIAEKVESYHRTVVLGCYASSPGKTFPIPKTTEVHCYWCAHSFDNEPCFLPVKEESGIYSIYGNFCTPQCALASLLNEHLDSHVRWERMALLHRMYRPRDSAGGRLYPAPPRESLIEFGGIYTYEEFRGHIEKGSIRVDINKPPLVSILGVLDTKPIDFYDSSLQNTLAQGFSIDRFKAWSEQGGALRLKRSKPLKDMDSTLDACIQIKIKRNVQET